MKNEYSNFKNFDNNMSENQADDPSIQQNL
jgi:hypothetical protein